MGMFRFFSLDPSLFSDNDARDWPSPVRYFQRESGLLVRLDAKVETQMGTMRIVSHLRKASGRASGSRRQKLLPAVQTEIETCSHSQTQIGVRGAPSYSDLFIFSGHHLVLSCVIGRLSSTLSPRRTVTDFSRECHEPRIIGQPDHPWAIHPFPRPGRTAPGTGHGRRLG